MKAFISKWSNWVFPATCVVTGQPGVKFDLSEQVLLRLKPVSKACFKCGFPLNGEAEGICGQCLQQPPYFDQTLAGFVYEDTIRALILRYKFQPEPQLARLLFELFFSVRQQDLAALKVSAVVPVPSHPLRLLERGFNPALELAKPLAQAINVPLLPFAVWRTKHTPAQSSLPLKKRQQNVKGAFAVQAEQFLGMQRVLLVDDVMTTGQTLSAIAKQLKAETVVAEVVNAVLARKN